MGLPCPLPFCSSTVLGTHPFSSLYPVFHPGQGFGSGSSLSGGKGRSRAGSPSFPRVLQPPLRRDESLRVVETLHRSVYPEPSRPPVSIQDGDTPVCAPFGEARGLDGVLGSQGCVLASASPPRQPQVPSVCSLGTGLPIQGSVLRPLHGPAGFLPRHGSSINFFTSLRHSHLSISRRLAPPGLHSGPRSPSPPPVSVVGDCDQRGEVKFGSFSKDCLLGMQLDSLAFRASPSQPRVEKLLSIAEEFLSSVAQPASSWQVLLGVLCSLIPLVPGGRLRMRSLQFCLHRGWDRLDVDALVHWDSACHLDLQVCLSPW